MVISKGSPSIKFIKDKIMNLLIKWDVNHIEACINEHNIINSLREIFSLLKQIRKRLF